MGHQYVKQPNGQYAIWSTIVDDFVLMGTDAEQVIAYEVAYRWTQELVGHILDAMNTLKEIDEGKKPYHQFTMTWEDCVDMIKENNPESDTLHKVENLGET